MLTPKSSAGKSRALGMARHQPIITVKNRSLATRLRINLSGIISGNVPLRCRMHTLQQQRGYRNLAHTLRTPSHPRRRRRRRSSTRKSTSYVAARLVTLRTLYVYPVHRRRFIQCDATLTSTPRPIRRPRAH